MSITKLPGSPLTTQFLTALKWAGFPEIDFNSKYDAEGAAELTFNIQKGRRCGAFEAFIEPILNRPNLVIHKYSRAYKV
jgi:hypothetical protein